MPITTTIRALTLAPHLAWAVVSGLLNEVRRTRRTRYRGDLLIHAGCKPPDPFLPDGTPVPRRLPRGALLGVAELVACTAEANTFAWVIARPRRLPSPVPCKGGLGLWVPHEVIASCHRCFAEQPIASLTEPFTCRRCGRSNPAILSVEGRPPAPQTPRG